MNLDKFYDSVNKWAISIWTTRQEENQELREAGLDDSLNTNDIVGLNQRDGMFDDFEDDLNRQ